MARHRHIIDVDDYEEIDDIRVERRNRSDRSNRKENTNNINKNTNNIDFNQFADLLQNIDIDQISSMLGGLMGGSAVNSGNSQQREKDDGDRSRSNSNKVNGGFDLGQIASILGGLGGSLAQGAGGAVPFVGDRRIELLNAIKPMLTPERANLIDVIVQLYFVSKILRR